jgi:hypothetical protein
VMAAAMPAPPAPITATSVKIRSMGVSFFQRHHDSNRRALEPWLGFMI